MADWYQVYNTRTDKTGVLFRLHMRIFLDVTGYILYQGISIRWCLVVPFRAFFGVSFCFPREIERSLASRNTKDR